MYIKRGAQGEVIAVSEMENSEFTEWMAQDHHELQTFLKTHLATSSLEDSDADFIRVLDDLINLLTEKRLIQFTDLPQAAQKKLLARESMRESVKSLNLLSDDENETIHL